MRAEILNIGSLDPLAWKVLSHSLCRATTLLAASISKPIPLNTWMSGCPQNYLSLLEVALRPQPAHVDGMVTGLFLWEPDPEPRV